MLNTEEARTRLDTILAGFAGGGYREYSQPIYGLGEEQLAEERPFPTTEETEQALGLAALLNVRLSDPFMELAQHNRYEALDAAQDASEQLAILVFGLGRWDRPEYYVAEIPDNFFDADIAANNARGGSAG